VNEIVLASPAKINLFLEIIRRRPDGFHEIESIMQLVDLCDEVRLRRRRGGIRLQVSGAELPEDRGNLAYRAAALALEAAGLSEGLEIRLVKRIPVAGGLGGGSSNAAAPPRGAEPPDAQPRRAPRRRCCPLRPQLRRRASG